MLGMWTLFIDTTCGQVRSGEVWLARHGGSGRDPALRRKNGYAQDDPEVGNGTCACSNENPPSLIEPLFYLIEEEKYISRKRLKALLKIESLLMV
jgi:hypothetical protein